MPLNNLKKKGTPWRWKSLPLHYIITALVLTNTWAPCLLCLVENQYGSGLKWWEVGLALQPRCWKNSTRMTHQESASAPSYHMARALKFMWKGCLKWPPYWLCRFDKQPTTTGCRWCLPSNRRTRVYGSGDGGPLEDAVWLLSQCRTFGRSTRKAGRWSHLFHIRLWTYCKGDCLMSANVSWPTCQWWNFLDAVCMN